MIEMENPQSLLAEERRRDQLGRSATVAQLAVLGMTDRRHLSATLGSDHADLDDIVSLLCRSLPSGEVLLADQPRITALARLLERGGLAELAHVRRSTVHAPDSPLQRMLDAFILGEGPTLEERDENELVASLDVWRWATEAVALAHLVGEVSVTPGKDAIESRLALLDVTRAVRRLAEAGCLGRDAALAQLHLYRRRDGRPAPGPPEPPMVVHGIGGVGKSTLVARFVLDLYEERLDPTTGLFAYLDLDRPTLADCTPATLLSDITAQVAAQVARHRRRLLRGTELKRRRERGAGLEAADAAWSFREQAHELVNDLREIADGAIVVVLDTYEQLQRNHPEQRGPVHDLFTFLAAELPNFRLIVSGRIPASMFVDPDRPDRVLHLTALDEAAAVELLRHFARTEAARTGRAIGPIDDDLGRQIVDLVTGIPLTLRLAARVLVQQGADPITTLAIPDSVLTHLRDEFVRGFLYQRILDHLAARGGSVTTDDLVRVARASIVLRRVTIALVEKVLAPSVLPAPAASAPELFEELAAEVAFVDLDSGVLRLREELRVPALVALRLADPELVQRVHEAAARFYDPPRTASEATELAYHRLALGASVEEFEDATLRRLDEAAINLPPSAAIAVHEAIRDPAARAAGRDLEAWESTALPTADAALRDGRTEEARRVLDERPDRSPATELHRLQSRLAQEEGDLAGAITAAALDLRAAETAADPRRYAAAALRLAALQELEDRRQDADDTLRHAEADVLVTGWPLVRLELLLNRMNLRERTQLGSADEHWLLGLAARALLQQATMREVEVNSALVRLLGAALGAEEPERIHAAVRAVGLGHDEDPVRVGRLIDALAAWDASLDPPGMLARAANLALLGDDPEAIRNAWSVLSGLGVDASPLDQLLAAAEPPTTVLDRLREIYLWWGFPDTSGTPPSSGRAHLQTDVPVDWSSPDILRLEELLQTAYPTSTELMSLASRIGLDMAGLSWASSSRRITRELIGQSSRAGLLADLVQAVLTDDAAVSVHQELTELVVLPNPDAPPGGPS